jgi:putative tricarboxylic transport membrane protein
VIGARLFGGVLLAFGIVCLIATFGVGNDWAASGPRLAPAVSSVLLIVLSRAYLVWPGRDLAEHVREATAGTHWPTPVLLVAALVGYALLIEPLGYALATTIFFWLAAWLLGSDRPGRDVAIGLALGVVTSFAFTQWLNVQLPTGPWGV